MTEYCSFKPYLDLEWVECWPSQQDFLLHHGYSHHSSMLTYVSSLASNSLNSKFFTLLSISSLLNVSMPASIWIFRIWNSRSSKIPFRRITEVYWNFKFLQKINYTFKIEDKHKMLLKISSMGFPAIILLNIKFGDTIFTFSPPCNHAQNTLVSNLENYEHEWIPGCLCGGDYHWAIKATSDVFAIFRYFFNRRCDPSNKGHKWYLKMTFFLLLFFL